MGIDQIAVGGYDSNFSYFLTSQNGETLLIDPVNADLLVSRMKQLGLILSGILITHSHFDHVEAVPDLLAQPDTRAPVYFHPEALRRLEKMVPAELRRLVDEGDKISFGAESSGGTDSELVEVLHTPGHIRDALCFYIAGTGALITGDTLFVEGCGKVGGYDGALEQLWNSLERLKMLPEDTLVYPGHDYGSKPVSTIRWEKEHNRFFLCGNFDEFKKERVG